jgi:hypothetical protein
MKTDIPSILWDMLEFGWLRKRTWQSAMQICSKLNQVHPPAVSQVLTDVGHNTEGTTSF